MTSRASADFMNRFSGTVQGWGKDDNGVTGIDLTQVVLTIRTRAFCNRKYQSLSDASIGYYFPNLLQPHMFCMDGGLRTDVGTCYGDSGGPTLIR